MDPNMIWQIDILSHLTQQAFLCIEGLSVLPRTRSNQRLIELAIQMYRFLAQHTVQLINRAINNEQQFDSGYSQSQ